MEIILDDEEIKRLVQMGKILESIGITSIEQAQKLKEHLTGCPGGMKCLEKLLVQEEK
jgi:hypothetical protein